MSCACVRYHKYRYRPWVLALASMLVVAWSASTTRAQLDSDSKKPYHLQVVLGASLNRVFTPVFHEQLERELANRLRLTFGALARVEVVRAHPLLGEIHANGLDAAIEKWDAMSERTTHFAMLDHAAGSYVVETRYHDGATNLAGPVATRTVFNDRSDLARVIAERINASFSPVGTVTKVGKDSVVLQLKAGELEALDRWLKKGNIFAVCRVAEEGGRRKAQRLEWAILEALEAPSSGACRCRYWHRYQEDALAPTPGTLGYRALMLATGRGPVKVQLLDDTTLAPLDGVRVRIQKPGSDKSSDLITNRDGYAITRDAFEHWAQVQVFSADLLRAQFPVELFPGRTVIARVKVQTDGESLAPFETRRDAWLRRVYDNVRLSSERSRDLSAQLHQSLDRALESARKSMPVLEAEVKYLQSERATLLKLSKEKKWRFDPGAGDAELDVLQRQVKELSEFIVRIETTLKSAGGDKSFGLVQLLERARLLEADAAYDQAIRVYEQVLQVSPAQKQVQAHLEKLKTAWKEQSPRHAKARAFLLQTWPALEVAELGKNMEYASDALAVCKAVDDRLTPRKVLRVNAGHTANLTRELEALKRRDSEDNRNRAKALGQVGEILLQLHQETAAWLGDGKK